MMKVAAIVPSAGSGRRMLSKTEDKPLIRICGKEMICYCLKALQNSSLVSEIIIASRPKSIPRIKKLIMKEGLTKVKEIVKGGKNRSQSVFNALSRVSHDIDFVLVHDAARPFITTDLIRRTINAAKRHGAALSAVKVSPTIKESGPKAGLVKRTLDRRVLWAAQTPQVFRKGLLAKAYLRAGRSLGSFTDDTSLVERIGHNVKIVEGGYSNIKITTAEDLYVAEAIIERKK